MSAHRSRATTLSVCCVANTPGPFLRAALAPLREIADEILIAAGGTVSNGDLACYGEVADAVFAIEFDFIERHLPWLHAQCRGDWILRLDGDEIPSPEMLAQVLAAKGDDRINSVLFARRHPFPTVAQYIVQEPWYPDFQVRMVRNDGSLRFSGMLHSSAERTPPSRITEACIYHLPFILGDASIRLTRADRYERLRPGLLAPTGLDIAGALLPEKLAGLMTVRIPDHHRHLLEAVLDESRASTLPGDATAVSLEEMDAFWAGRVLQASAYRASISLIGTPAPFGPGESRPVYFLVRNDGDELWGWDPSIGPYLHLVYRLVREGKGEIEDWRPAFFTEWVRPGSSTIVPTQVDVPTEPGRYLLEVKIRHAPGRLFGDSQEIRIVVRSGGAWSR